MNPSAVVTGASRGIGEAIALALADRGLNVALLARDTVRLESVKAQIESKRVRALPLACDVTQSKDVDAARDAVVAQFGIPNIVVNNAGIVHRVAIDAMTESQWDEVVDVNLKGTFLVTRAFLRTMVNAGRGRFIAIGSISSTLGTARSSAYCAAKWGVVGFTKSLAEELRGTGLQTACVLPGSVDTAMLKGSGFAPQMVPTEVARVVVYAALDAPDAMNGSAIEVFGS